MANTLEYATVSDYAGAVARYVASEFSDLAHASEREIALWLQSTHAGLLHVAFEARYLPCILGECLVSGKSLRREAASCSGSPYFDSRPTRPNVCATE